MLTNLEYSVNILRNTETSIFMKISPVEADFFPAYGQSWQTDMTSLIGACRNFANGPKNGRWYGVLCWTTWCYINSGNSLNTLLSKNLKTSWNKMFLFVSFFILVGQCCTSDVKQFPVNDTKGIAKCIQDLNQQSKSQGHTNQHINNKFTSETQTWNSDVCNKVLLEKLRVPQLDKKFPTFYETRRFSAAFANTPDLSLSWVTATQSMPSHPTFWSYILILSPHIVKSYVL